MADVIGPDYLDPLEEEARVFRYPHREVDSPINRLSLDYGLDDVGLDESLLNTTVPEPVRVRGVGGTTM